MLATSSGSISFNSFITVSLKNLLLLLLLLLAREDLDSGQQLFSGIRCEQSSRVTNLLGKPTRGTSPWHLAFLCGFSEELCWIECLLCNTKTGSAMFYVYINFLSNLVASYFQKSSELTFSMLFYIWSLDACTLIRNPLSHLE